MISAQCKNEKDHFANLTFEACHLNKLCINLGKKNNYWNQNGGIRKLKKLTGVLFDFKQNPLLANRKLPDQSVGPESFDPSPLVSRVSEFWVRPNQLSWGTWWLGHVQWFEWWRRPRGDAGAGAEEDPAGVFHALGPKPPQIHRIGRWTWIRGADGYAPLSIHDSFREFG